MSNSGLRVSQINPADLHGTDVHIQTSDGTGVSGHLAAFDAAGGLTDSGSSGGGSGGPSGSYNINFGIVGQPSGGSAILALFVFTEAVNFAANWSGSEGKAGSNPAAAQSWTLNKNGSSVGTVSISTGGIVTFSSSGTISFAAGDFLTLVGSSSQDTSLANVDIVLAGIRASVTSTPINVIPFSWIGQPAGSQLLGMYTFTNAITFQANWSGAAGKVGTNPAATWTATIYKNGSSVGTVSVSTSGVFTFTSASGTSVAFVAGDEITAVAQSTIDTALQNIVFSLSGSAGGYVQLGGDLGGSSTSPIVIGVNGKSIAISDDTGVANAYAVTPPYGYTRTKYARLIFRAANASTGACTLNDGSGALNLNKGGSTALVSGDIASGQIVEAIFDGSYWQMISWSGASGGSGGSVPVAISSGPDWPPTTPGSLDDEFTAVSLSGAWTWVNQGTATAMLSKSILALLSPAHSGVNWEYIYQPAPATPWEVQAKCAFLAGFQTANCSAGIVLSDSTGKIVHFGPSTNFLIKVQYYNSPTSFNSAPGTDVNPAQPNTVTVYLRVRDDGTNLTFWVSINGSGWHQINQLARMAFLTTAGPTRVGLGVDSENSQDVMLESDWFRRTL